MKILGISPYLSCSGSALIIDGKLKSAALEERFNRKKNSSDFPYKSIEWCLEKEKVKFDELDLIAIPWNPILNIKNASGRWSESLRWRGEYLVNIPTNLMKLSHTNNNDHFEMKWGKTRVVFLNHHECHVAFSYFQSNFQKADFLSLDGRGELESCTLGRISGKKFKKIDHTNYPHSLGVFYSSITEFLGFKSHSDEWKVMALASYSKKKNKFYKFFNNLIKIKDTKFEIDISYFDYYNFYKIKYLFSNKLISILGQPRKKFEKISFKHKEIAGALQRVFEKKVIDLLKILKKKSDSKNLIFTGGSALNSVLNGIIEKTKIYNKVYISYAPDDSGLAIGSALNAFNKFSNNKFKQRNFINNSFFGPEYSNNEIRKILNRYKVAYTFEKNIEAVAAKLLYDNNILGWFQGRMEFGPRALGNRSIISNPFFKKNKEILNKAIKFRESFRPFAPAVLIEKQNEIFEKPKDSNIYFMEKVFKIKKKWRNIIPSATHVDGSGRIQTVSKKSNLKFYNLINEFYKLSNIPVLINTSFNLNNEPIVMTPEDAIRTFFSSGLDFLIIGNFLVRKK